MTTAPLVHQSMYCIRLAGVSQHKTQQTIIFYPRIDLFARCTLAGNVQPDTNQVNLQANLSRSIQIWTEPTGTGIGGYSLYARGTRRIV